MKLFSSVMMYALLAMAAEGGAWIANAEPSMALASAVAQDAAEDSGAATVSGAWQISFADMNGNPRQATLQIEQDGSRLSGTFQGECGSAPLSGSLQGNQMSLTAKARGREISFTGTVDGNKMSGTTGQGKDWTAARQ